MDLLFTSANTTLLCFVKLDFVHFYGKNSMRSTGSAVTFAGVNEAIQCLQRAAKELRNSTLRISQSSKGQLKQQVKMGRKHRDTYFFTLKKSDLVRNRHFVLIVVLFARFGK